MQALIVLSGAAVRLTQAGLGCEDWPTCNEDELLPEWELHGLIEFGNRVISGFVAASAIVAVVFAYRVLPRRPDLIRYSWGLVVGTLAQVVLGGITVLADLHPIVVSVHFLLSMILLWNAQLLWVCAGRSQPAPAQAVRTRSSIDPMTGRLARLQLAAAGVVLLTGTVVTGTGPNSGDSRADRLDFELTTVARVHGVCVWLFLACLTALVVRLVRSSPPAIGAARWLLLAVVAQGALGYTQFALGVPPGLVELHVLGAIVVWSIAIQFYIHLLRPPDGGEVDGHDNDRPDRALMSP